MSTLSMFRALTANLLSMFSLQIIILLLSSTIDWDPYDHINYIISNIYV